MTFIGLLFFSCRLEHVERQSVVDMFTAFQYSSIFEFAQCHAIRLKIYIVVNILLACHPVALICPFRTGVLALFLQTASE